MRLNIQEIKTIKVSAEDYYSREYLEVMEGEAYSFSSANSPKWVDWLIPSTADGFWNPILLNSKKRVKGASCFKLCGTIGENENAHFIIGSELKSHQVIESGLMYFFANDHFEKKYYENNKGYIDLTIIREN